LLALSTQPTGRVVRGEKTLTDVNHFSFGWVNPALSVALSVAGCMLGIMLASKARRRSGLGRGRLIIYAACAFGGIGIWLSQVVALLGVSVPEAVVRYDPAMLGVSLAVALIDVGTGLLLVTRGRLVAGTLIPAGLVLGLGAAATSYTTLVALRASATITYDPVRFSATVALCVLLAPFALWSLAALRGLLSTVVTSVLLGLVICGINYGGQWAMLVQFRHSTTEVPGLSAVTLMAPLILGGCTVAVMLAYFTIGSSTMRELRAIYDPHDRQEETIEPWLIEEVTARVVNGTMISPLPAYLSSRHLGRSPVPGRARPAPGTRPTWQRSPAWGSELARNDADRRRTWPTARPRPTEPVVVVTVTPPPMEVSAVLPRRPVSAPPAPPAAAVPEPVTTLTATATVVEEAAPAAPPTNSKRWRNRRR
jgi:NO-binding membrane sensor protein with MHYT domain